MVGLAPIPTGLRPPTGVDPLPVVNNDMNKVLYVACSPFSGSTLLCLVLNTHTEVFTVGHTTGWAYPEGEEFYCSCGEELNDCGFWKNIAAAMRNKGLPFEFRNFGTDYRLVMNDRLNRYLTSQARLLRGRGLEEARNTLVKLNPAWAATLRRQDEANAALIGAALSFGGARVFVDNSHDPYRLQHLRRIESLDFAALHLVRDPRGVVNSHRKNHGHEVRNATRNWIRRQKNIVGILGNLSEKLTVYYEDFCARTDETLARIHQFVGLEPQAFPGRFDATEHHVLGNVMRLGASTISEDTRWRSELSKDDQQAICALLAEAARRDTGSPLASLIDHYLGSA